MRADVAVHTDIVRSPRVMQVESMFDVPPSERAEQSWTVDVPFEDRDWNVGLIVGPSGAGKTTVARALFGDQVAYRHVWPDDRGIVDAFPEGMSVYDVAGLLSAVGLSSVPAWVRPYRTLSTGEQFRADVAVTLAEQPTLAVVDEWTSTVDRQVGKVVSAAAAKAVRRREQRLVAVTCHYDVEEWLDPDWIYQPHLGTFAWRHLHPRPGIALSLCPVDRAAWRVFSHHHYLSAHLPAGDSWGAFTADGDCVAFVQIGPIVHPSPKAKRVRRLHRVVVLPDWQGIGVGTRVSEALAQQYAAAGFRVRITTAHVGLVRYFKRSPRWQMSDDIVRVSNMAAGPGTTMVREQYGEARRLSTRSFEYRAPSGSLPRTRTRLRTC